MELTEEHLKTIEQMAKTFFNVKDIATVLQVDPDQLEEEIQTEGTAAYNHFNAGSLRSELEFWEKQVELAKAGDKEAGIRVAARIQKFKMQQNG